MLLLGCVSVRSLSARRKCTSVALLLLLAWKGVSSLARLLLLLLLLLVARRRAGRWRSIGTLRLRIACSAVAALLLSVRCGAVHRLLLLRGNVRGPHALLVLVPRCLVAQTAGRLREWPCAWSGRHCLKGKR